MTAPSFLWTEASGGDEQTLIALMQAFYAEDDLVFTETKARMSIRGLLADLSLGQIFLLKTAEMAVGYLVLTFGYSLEFHGRFVLLDELYLSPVLRGQGQGKLALAFAESWARQQGVTALRLEVNHTNLHAKSVYLKSGFKDERRDIMTRWLTTPN